MAPNNQDRGPAQASRARFIALALGAAALLVGVALFAQWQAAPTVDRTVASGVDLAVEDSSAVDGLVDVKGVVTEGATREAAPEEPVDVAQVGESRPAYPVSSKLELAVLDVLAVWEFTDESAVDQLLQCGLQFGRTDAFGRVRFEGLSPGHWGLMNGAGSHMNLEFEAGELRSTTFSIRREYGVEGRVVDEAGAAVAAAEVLVCSTRNGPSIALVKASADGTFRLDALSGPLALSARHPMIGVSDPVALRPGGSTEESLTIVVRGGTGALEGTLVDSEGFAVSGAGLWYAPSQADGLPPLALPPLALAPARSSARTDDAGRFQFEALRPGPGELRFWTANYISKVSQVEIVQGETQVILVELASGVTLSGRVIHDVTGEPIHQASVTIGEKDDPAYCGAWSDDRGGFVIDRVPSMPAELRVEILGEVVYTQSIDPVGAVSSPLELRVTPTTVSVHGFVVDEEGNPVVGCEVYAEGDGQDSYTVTTDEEGAFRISNAPATATALVAYDTNQDRQLASMPRALPATGPVTIVVPLERLQTGKIRGVVVGPDGKPVSAADVELEFSDGSGMMFTDSMVDGTFGFDAAAAGKSSLTIRASGYAEWLAMVEVEADEAVDLGRLALERGATFRLELSFDPPLEEDERVQIWENRIDDGTDHMYLYLGESRDAKEPLGPVPPGRVSLLLKGAGVRRTLELEVDAEGTTREALEIQHGAPTLVTIEYPAGDSSVAAPVEGEVMSYGQSWVLRAASGDVVERSYRPQGHAYGKPLELHGLSAGAEFTLDVTDIEGRSGSVRFQAGSEPTILVQ